MIRKFIGLDERGYVSGEPTEFVEVQHKQIPVSSYTYKANKAKVTVCAVIPPWDNQDALLLHIRPQKGRGTPLEIRMRPDEALMISKLLIDAVYKTTITYEFGLEK